MTSYVRSCSVKIGRLCLMSQLSKFSCFLLYGSALYASSLVIVDVLDAICIELLCG